MNTHCRQRLVFAVSATLLLSSVAEAADLTKIDRSIAKEPIYQKRPKYCLLVLGPQAAHRAWVVIDGDTLYLDHNGNGDLTDPGERFPGEKQADDSRPENPYREQWFFRIRDLRFPGSRIHSPTIASRTRIKRDYQGDDPYALQLKVREAADPSYTHASIHVTFGGHKGKDGLRPFVQQAMFGEFADKPSQAPIFHVDGPLSVVRWPRRTFELTRGQPDAELYFTLGVPSLGHEVFSYRTYDDIPEDVHPILQVEFPPARPGQKPATAQIALKRC